MFTYHTTIRLHDTDAAGILFFSNQFKMAHDAFEAFLESINYPISCFLQDCNFSLPIVHAESDYLAPLNLGDSISIAVKVEKIGETSFTLCYNIFNKEKKLMGKVTTVHVSVDRNSGGKIRLPKDFKDKLMSQMDITN